MFSFQDLTHSAFEESIKAHLFGKLNFVKTVADFFQALANLHDKYAQEMESIVTSYKYKAQNDRPKYGSTLLDLWDAILHIVDLDAKCHSELAQSLLKNAAVALSDFYDSKTQLYNRISAHRANLLQLIEKNTLDAHETFRTYCDAHARHRTNSCKINKAAMLRAHNDYVLQVQATNAIIDLFHCDEMPLIMKDLYDTDCCTSAIFCEAADTFIASSINFASQQKLRYEAVRNDECPQVSEQSDVANFVKHCEAQLPDGAEYLGREPMTLDYRLPPTVKNTELMANELVNDKLVASEMRERLAELQRFYADMNNNVHSASDVLCSFQNMMQSQANMSKSPSNMQLVRSASNNRFTSVQCDRKVCELQVDICRKSCEMRLQMLELAGIRKKIELLCKATNNAELTADDRSSKRSRTPSMNSEGVKSGDSTSLSSVSNISQNSNSNSTSERTNKSETIPSKLLSVAAWKQTISWWRKGEDQKTHAAKANSSNQQESVNQIDPIYSLLRCATNLPRRLSVSGNNPLHSKPTSPVRRPESASKLAPTMHATSSSAYQLAPAQNSIIERRCSMRSIHNGASNESDADLLQMTSKVSVPNKKLNSSAEQISTTQKSWLPTSSSFFSSMHNATLCGQCQRPVGLGVPNSVCDCICHKPDMLPTINLQDLKPNAGPPVRRKETVASARAVQNVYEVSSK